MGIHVEFPEIHVEVVERRVEHALRFGIRPLLGAQRIGVGCGVHEHILQHVHAFGIHQTLQGFMHVSA